MRSQPGADLEKKATEFISFASHQLRTPLGSIRWNLEMLLSGEYGQIPKNIKDILTQIYKSDLWMIDLVNDLLSVSRIDQGRVFDEPKPTDITQLIKAVASEIQVEAQKRSLVGELHFDKKPIPKITIDAKRFREVIHNLLTNAIKYNKEKGRITVAVKKGDNGIYISVSDTGVGISEHDRKHIFSKYFRAGNATRMTNEGTGLGLYIVKSYVQDWGGKISYESTVGKGTTFTIQLPFILKKRKLPT